VKTNAPKKIVCSVLIGLLQFGGGALMAEAATPEGQRRQHQEMRDDRNPDERHRPDNWHSEKERMSHEWQNRRERQERDLAHWRSIDEQRRESAMRRMHAENEREWRHRQWLEEQRIQRQREDMRQRQWWEHQRHEQEMRRREFEDERAWRHRQWEETQRHESELRQIEIAILSIALLTK
jgi:hypothetical protein